MFPRLPRCPDVLPRLVAHSQVQHVLLCSAQYPPLQGSSKGQTASLRCGKYEQSSPVPQGIDMLFLQPERYNGNREKMNDRLQLSRCLTTVYVCVQQWSVAQSYRILCDNLGDLVVLDLPKVPATRSTSRAVSTCSLGTPHAAKGLEHPTCIMQYIYVTIPHPVEQPEVCCQCSSASSSKSEQRYPNESPLSHVIFSTSCHPAKILRELWSMLGIH